MQEQELTLEEIQRASYYVLKKIATICDKQNWKYFLTYGSMIGAIRHKGIIPWDDDIDLMMPRPDYEKLRLYFIEHQDELMPLKLFDKSITPNYPHMIMRISDQRYHLIFDNEKDYNIGLFVDIYPLDGVGNDYKKAIKFLRKNKKLASLCFLTSRKTFATDNTESHLKMILKFPAYFVANIMGNKYYISKLNKRVKLYSFENSKYVACSAWPAGKKYGRERDVFKKELFETHRIPFEDSMMPIPIGYDTFLSITYGDYMTPPTEEKRKTHHTYHAFQRK